MKKYMWDTIKIPNIWITGIEEEDVKPDIIENTLYNIIWENFLNIEIEIGIKIQQAFSISNRQNDKTITASHIIVKILNIKKKEKTIENCKSGESHIKPNPAESQQICQLKC
jgi:hypothetical protein